MRYKQSEAPSHLRARAFERSEKAKRAERAAVKHDWAGVEWEEMRMDAQFASSEADIALFERGVPLADLVEEDYWGRFVSDLMRRVKEVKEEEKMAQGWRNLAQGWFETGEGFSRCGGAYT